jgi:hypothetical protein
MLRTLQTNLTGGAVSADAKDRLDLAIWKNSVRRAENVSIKPQGGATRRPGTAVIDSLPADLSYQIEAFTFSQAQSYVFVFSDTRVDIWNKITRTGVASYLGMPWTDAMVANRELVVVQSFDTMFVFHPDFETLQFTRTGSASFTYGTINWGFLDDGAGPIPRMPMQKFVSGNSYLQANNTTGAATFQTNVSGLFQTAHVGTWFRMFTIPIFMTGYVSDTQINGTIYGTLPIAANVPTLDWQEQAFSSVHGWARCGTLHEQRLWIGGGRDAPNTIWGSTTYDPLNFELGTGQPTDAIKFVAAQDRVAEIKRMVSFRHLQLFTADGEFYAPTPSSGALTPANFSVKQQSAYGIANSDARRFDQTTIFISRAANAVREFIYDDFQQSYTADALTFMAKDYIRSPVDLDVSIETATAQEALCIITNGDGTLAVLAKVRRENVGGWMLWNTDGLFKSCGVIDREIWTVTEHGAPGSRWLSVFDPNYVMDFAAKLTAGSPTVTWGPFPFHIGMTVDACSGDLYLGQFLVNSSGMITVGTPISNIEIGHAFIPLVQPLVQEVQMPDGVTWGQPKRNVSVTISLVGTLSAQVNNDHIPTSNAVEDPALAPDRYTGQFKCWLLGVSAAAAPVITAPLPLAFNLTTIQTEVEV